MHCNNSTPEITTLDQLRIVINNIHKQKCLYLFEVICQWPILGIQQSYDSETKMLMKELCNTIQYNI